MELKTGLTTGTCAAAACKAAATLLLEDDLPSFVELTLPKGEVVRVQVSGGFKANGIATATVVKDAGDDPDVTNGIEISVTLQKQRFFTFHAGDGVGTITKTGLQMPVGHPAINPVPRRMMIEAISTVTNDSFAIIVSAKNGMEIAKKTFNPRLGIINGISILGTTGIVKPFNRKALQDSVILNINVAKGVNPNRCVLVPGNIGAKGAEKHLNIPFDDIVEVSNEWDCGLKYAIESGFKEIYVIGHPGKICKFINQEFYTRSKDSLPALGVVKEFADKLNLSYDSDTKTVEGIFCSLKDDEQLQLGNLLCAEVKKKTKQSYPGNYKLNVAIHLMNKKIVGEYCE